MQDANSILTKRANQLRKKDPVSIEVSAAKAGENSIEALPSAIDDLIDNKAYRNRYRKLIREGHLSHLLRLAAIARTKDKPNRWFVKACSVAMWERTLDYLRKVVEVERLAAEVARQLGTRVTGMTYKAVWKLGHDAVLLAVRAREQGRHRSKMFAWFVSHASDPGVLDGGSAA